MVARNVGVFGENAELAETRPLVVVRQPAQADGDGLGDGLRALGVVVAVERRQPFLVEKLIGLGVAAPALMNGAAHILGDDRALSDLLVGVTGDFVPASALLAPRALGRLALGLARGAVSSWFSRPTPSHAPSHVHRS